MRKNLLLFCSSISNSHMTKDIVVIPYLLQKYFDFNSEIVTLNVEDDLIDNNIYLGGLCITTLDSPSQLDDKLLNTDLLVLFGLYNWNFEVIELYKSINPLGKIYLKLDANMYWMFDINKKMNSDILNILKKCSLITTESRRLQHLLNMSWNLNIKFIPNGYYNFTGDFYADYEKKDNIIMFAGRVGSPEKCNDLLLEAFKNIHDKIPNWKLELVGPVDDNFLVYINNYFRNNPSLVDKVLLTGSLNKSDLKKKYESAKVFCITSIIEACANVFSEALSNGCYIVSSDVDGAIDIINYGEFGKIFPCGNLQKLQDSLLYACTNDNLLKDVCHRSQEYCKDELSWVQLCGEINNMLNTNL